MVSVIIPLYNKEQIVERSIRSVLSQDYDDFEVVVVNDGSTDRSMEVVRGIGDARIQIVEQENGGPSKARNTGVRYAKGEWIVFLDADDELLPGALRHFDWLVQKNPDTNMFLCEVLVNDGKHKWLHTEYREGMVKNIFRAHVLGMLMQCSGSTMYRRMLCESHPYDERIRRYEDLECLFRKYRGGYLWVSHRPVAMVNCIFAEASCARKDIDEDFMGHLDFRGKCFWERMSLYAFYLGERDYYGEQTKRLYPTLRYRYDLLVIYKMLKALTSLLKRI